MSGSIVQHSASAYACIVPRRASTAGAASQPVNLASPAADLSLGRHVFQLVSTVDADKNAKMLAEAKPNKSIICESFPMSSSPL